MTYLALTLPGGYAVNAPAGIPQGGINTTGVNVISVGVSLLFIFASILSLFYLLYGGFKWITSSGDQEKIASARLTIIYAIAGLALSFFSYLIINIVGTFFGVNLLALP